MYSMFEMNDVLTRSVCSRLEGAASHSPHTQKVEAKGSLSLRKCRRVVIIYHLLQLEWW